MTGGAAAAEELRRRVEAAAEGTPYVVTPTAKGFDVTLDIADARWFGMLNKAGLSRVYTHHVAVRGDGSYTVTDDIQAVEWVAGVPQAKGSAERVHGRVKELGFQKVWALDEDGRFGQVVDLRFSSEEGRDLVAGVAEQLGLRLRRGAAETTGIVFGVIGGVGAVVSLVVMLVLLLLGKF